MELPEEFDEEILEVAYQQAANWCETDTINTFNGITFLQLRFFMIQQVETNERHIASMIKMAENANGGKSLLVPKANTSGRRNTANF